MMGNEHYAPSNNDYCDEEVDHVVSEYRSRSPLYFIAGESRTDTVDADDKAENNVNDGEDGDDGSKVKRIIEELRSTEKTYVEQLSVLKTYFMEPIQRLVTTDVYQSLFSNDIQTIYDLNHQFLTKLNSIMLPHEQVDNNHHAQDESASKDDKRLSSSLSFPSLLLLVHDISKLMLAYSEMYREPYASYIGHKSSNNTSDYDNVRRFPQIIAKLEKDGKNPDIDHYRITVVQRIPRYQLLFEGLLRHLGRMRANRTVTEQREYGIALKVLGDALESIKNTAVACNDEKYFNMVQTVNDGNGRRRLIKRFKSSPPFKYFSPGKRRFVSMRSDLYVCNDCVLFEKKRGWKVIGLSRKRIPMKVHCQKFKKPDGTYTRVNRSSDNPCEFQLSCSNNDQQECKIRCPDLRMCTEVTTLIEQQITHAQTTNNET